MKGEITNPLLGHTRKINVLVSTGNYLFSGSDDAAVRIWDTDAVLHIATYLMILNRELA